MIAMATAPSKIPVTRVGKNLERRVGAICEPDSAAILNYPKLRIESRGKDISIRERSGSTLHAENEFAHAEGRIILTGINPRAITRFLLNRFSCNEGAVNHES